MKYNLRNRPKCVDGECDGFGACKWFEGFEACMRLFIAIHENEGRMISPKLMRKEILGE